MKKTLLLLLAVLTGACSLSEPVLINTIRPADITVASEIQTILLLDRTVVRRDDWLSIGESILTGELPFEDRVAAQQALNALKQQLQTSPRFEVVIASERMVGNSLSGAFPDPIPWSEQKALLRKYQADALLSIEIMDSDFLTTEGVRMVKETVGEGKRKRTVERKEFYAEGVGQLKMGFRFYDTPRRNIIDQQLISERRTWRKSARSKAEALAQLIGKSEATRRLAEEAGADYAYKVAPMPVQLRRQFYTKAKESQALEQGARLAEVNDWSQAIEVWQAGIKEASREKDRGRMALNIAVGYEVLGQFDLARDWAQKAYALYGEKRARSYVSLLEQRIQSEARVEEQMNP